MNSFVLALRAVGTHLAMRLYVPVVASAAIVMALLIGGGLWLTTVNNWWWLLLIPITSLFCIVLAIAAVVLMLIRFVRPAQSKAQKQAVKKFVDKLQAVAEIAGTPKGIILFRIIRSVTAPSKDSYLSELVENKQLANDFRDLQRSFDDVIVIE